jgi:hypothetical protein
MRLDELFAPQALMESPATQSGFQILAQTLLRSLATRITSTLSERLAEDPDYVPELWRLPATTFGTAYPNGKGLKKLPEPVRKFVKANPSLRLYVDEPNARLNGIYRSKPHATAQAEIGLFMDPAWFTEIQEAARQGRLTYWIVINFLSKRTDVLVHEIAHAYDDWASNGKFRDNARSLTAKANPKNFDLYLTDPIEINARFMQTVSKMAAYRRGSWKDYLSAFKQEFTGWRLLSVTDKRRLMQRLAAVYSQDRVAPPMNIAAQAKALAAKLSERFGIPILLNYHAVTDTIDVTYLPTRDRTIQQFVLQAAARLADIYRKTVEISEAVPQTLLKALGFVRNRGRNKDFRLSTPWYRPSRRATA